MIHIDREMTIDDGELQFSFIRAGGPGGQKVNKTSSAVQLSFDLGRSPSIAPELRAHLRAALAGRLTREGVLIITAQRFRSQQQNRQDAIDRLVALLRRAAHRPAPRRPTGPSRAARRRRLDDKRRRGQTKRLRGRARGEE